MRIDILFTLCCGHSTSFTMEGLILLEPTDLYNMLQQATQFTNLSDPNYLLLIGTV